ncbi:MAG: sodium:calcium antiporter [Thermoplasmatota archaeon]
MVAGFFLLNEGAKFVTDVASALARKSGHSAFVIGILLVSALAALPEILVTLLAISLGSPRLALGNAIGSIIVNLSFMIGLASVSSPIHVSREIVFRDFAFLVTIKLVVIAFLWDGVLTRSEGVVLILLFVPYALNLLFAKETAPKEEVRQRISDLNVELELLGRISHKFVVVRASARWLLAGVALLFVGAEVATRGTLAIAGLFGVPEYLLGLTVVAVGTSLPDIAASFHASRKGHSDLALAVALGANVFTLLLNLGLIAVLSPLSFPVRAMLLTVAFVLLQVALISMFLLRGRVINRVQGAVLLALYPVYVILQIALGSSGL